MTPFGTSIKRGTRTTLKLVGADVAIRTSYDSADIAASLEALSISAKHLQPVLDDYGAYIVDKHIQNQFKRQGTPKRWAALSRDYAAWKLANYGRKPILVLTGRMKAGFKWQATARTLVIKNSRKYWQYHQDGTDKMPARPVMQIGKRDRDQLIRIAHRHFRFDEGIGL